MRVREDVAPRGDDEARALRGTALTIRCGATEEGDDRDYPSGPGAIDRRRGEVVPGQRLRSYRNIRGRQTVIGDPAGDGDENGRRVAVEPSGGLAGNEGERGAEKPRDRGDDG
jgi:hypothetical protein